MLSTRGATTSLRRQVELPSPQFPKPLHQFGGILLGHATGSVPELSQPLCQPTPGSRAVPVFLGRFGESRAPSESTCARSASSVLSVTMY
jgi:hypothetical protein